jgi:hypothetical protein
VIRVRKTGSLTNPDLTGFYIAEPGLAPEHRLRRELWSFEYGPSRSPLAP